MAADRYVAYCLILGLALTMVGPDTIAASRDLQVAENPILPCGSTPNCVASTGAIAARTLPPLPLKVHADAALAAIRAVMASMPRTTLESESEDMLHYSCRSRWFGFVDRVDFWIDRRNNLIHFRSAADSGYWDFGVNRRRIEKVLRSLRHQEIG